MTENFVGITDTGRVRDNNEDAFIAERAKTDTFIIACVIDGVGGYAYGEVAATVARQAILDYFSQLSEPGVFDMKEAIITANNRILAEKQRDSDYDNMACVLTLVIVDTEKNQFLYGHVGDTRLYLLRDDSLIKVVKDHSFVGFLEDSGRLSEAAAMRHPKRNEIDKALGFREQIDTPDDYIESGQSPFLPGDMLLLCSDGLTDLVPKKEITAILTGAASLAEKGAALVEEANAKGGKDNITVVLVQHDKALPEPMAIRPAINQKNDEHVNQKAPVPSTDSRAPDPIVTHEPSHRQMLLTGLSVACLTLLAMSLWLLRQNQTGEPAVEKRVLSTGSRTESSQTGPTDGELQLQAALNGLTGDTLLLTNAVFAQPISVSRAVLVNRNSLYIKTQGTIVLTRAGSYAGPAIRLAPSSGHLVLDGLCFDGFDVAVSAQNQGVVLKNVTFRRCRVPVQRAILFPDSRPVNARLTGNSRLTDVPAN
ncbi:MAG: serine/threonine-protein phosphatase [Spirosoma sp.]|nr:serine/threonine-protein phosphatase [Spirosoma sp.]